MRDLCGSKRRNSPRSVWREISASVPASSTPGAPAPTTTKVSQATRLPGSGSRPARPAGARDNEVERARPPRRIRFALGALVSQENARADLERVLERLEARR